MVDPTITWIQQAELVASDGAFADYFGNSVAVSGNTAVIGAFDKTINGKVGPGAAYVFVQSGGTWSQQAELIASDGVDGDYFGFSVAIDGDTIVVGANEKPFNQFVQGAAYVFVRNAGAWSQQAKLLASDSGFVGEFGHSVAVNGDTVLVGTRTEAAYVFLRTGGAWNQQAKLAPSDAPFGDEFGSSVSLSGETAVVGAWQKTVSGNAAQGVAYVFVRSAGTWSQQAELTASDGGAFGISVSISGDTLLVGSPGTGGGASLLGIDLTVGAAFVFVRSGTTWSQQQEIPAPSSSFLGGFGGSVSVDGNIAVIGAPTDSKVGLAVGSAYVFIRTGATWAQQPELTASEGLSRDQFGSAVSLSGYTILIGAPSKNVNTNTAQGVAYVFVPSTPTLASSLTIVKAFTPSAIQVGSGSTLSFTITNPNTVMLTGVGFTDALPSGITIGSGAGLSAGCNLATAQFGAVSQVITLANAQIAAGGTCVAQINVIGSAIGQFPNMTSAVTSDQAPPGSPAMATLTVVGAPVITKAFGAPQIQLFGPNQTSLTFTITNTSMNPIALSGISFGDSLPAGLIIATPNNQMGSCGNGTITATAGTSNISLTGAMLAPGSACSFSVDVIGTLLGDYLNTTSPVTALAGTITGNAAQAHLSVVVDFFLSFFTDGGGAAQPH